MNILLYYHFIIYYIYHSANISKHDEMMTAARSTFPNVRFHGMWSRSFDHTVCNAQLSSLWSVRLLCSIMQMMQRVRCACTHSARRFGSRLWSLTDCVDPSGCSSHLWLPWYITLRIENRDDFLTVYWS